MFVSIASNAWNMVHFFWANKKKTQQCTVVSSIPYTRANSNTYNTQSVTFTHTCADPSVVCNIHVPTKATARATIKQRERIKEKRSTLTTERRRKGAPEAYGGVKKAFSFLFFSSCNPCLAIGSSNNTFSSHPISVNTCKYRFWVILKFFPPANLHTGMQYSNLQQASL